MESPAFPIPGSEPLLNSHLPTFLALRIDAGKIRRVWFEADGAEPAQEICLRFGLGFAGPANPPRDPAQQIPEAYDIKAAGRLMGGVGRTTIYKELVLGNLERVAGTRRVLITRKSLERRCAL
jgi:hypothetical protein